MLLALSELGRVPSSRVAEALEVNASSVTRLADRLVDEGYIDRGSDEHSRTVVTLELSGRGRELVGRVVTWRHDELGRLLAQIDPARRAAAADALEDFVQAAASIYSTGYRGPVAL
jgi:DNA-binding MarR family transcriptional regulator